MNNVVADREKGQFPVSIGTSLALEGALGVHPEKEKENKPPLRNYNEVWFNLYTLFRNLMGSMKADAHYITDVHELYLGLHEDILGCNTVIDQESNHKAKAVFYLNDYSSLYKDFPHAKFKVMHTVLQQAFQAFETNTLIRLMRDPPVPVEQYAYAIKGIHPASLIVTHLPVDLFAKYRFATLDLLESYTGAIKPPALWASKLTGTAEETHLLPFNRFTLQLFGDGQQFLAQPMALKKAVSLTAKEAKWSAITTMEKIKFTLPQYVKDRLILDKLQGFF